MLTLLLLACHKNSADSSEPAGAGQDSSAVDSVPAGTGQDSSAVDSAPATDTAPPPPSDFSLTSTDEETWAALGYRAEVYEDTTGVVGVDGSPATFTWIRPAQEPVTGVLLYLHGSTAADDGEDPTACTLDAAREAQLRFLIGWGAAPYLAMERGMAILSPLDAWCDVWLGLGPDDPVDTSHYGWAMIDRSLDWALSASSGVSVEGPVVSWGTSTGSIGAALAVARRDEVTAGIIDSGPIDFEDRSQAGFAATLRHVLGGDPREFPERYRASSPVALVEDGVLTEPLFEVNNALDEVTEPVHGLNLLAAFQSAYAPKGLRYGWQDFNHDAPGESHHVQSGLRPLPWSYTTGLMMDFLLDGVRLEWREAEDLCDGCTVGEPLLEGDWPTAASGGAVIAATTLDGPGLIFTAPPPSTIPAGATPRGTAVLTAQDLDGRLRDDDEVATLRWTIDGVTESEQPVRFGDLSQDSAISELSRHIQATTLALPGALPSEGEVRFEVEVTGRALILLDAVVYGW